MEAFTAEGTGKKLRSKSICMTPDSLEPGTKNSALSSVDIAELENPIISLGITSAGSL
jgi:hypothetical protein